MQPSHTCVEATKQVEPGSRLFSGEMRSNGHKPKHGRYRFGYTEKLCHHQWIHGTGCPKRPCSLPPQRLNDPDKALSNPV